MSSNTLPINKTTKLLYLGFFRLLSNISFEKITVNDICKESLVSRSTFYSYFQDKYHLTMFCLDIESNRLGLIDSEELEKNLTIFLGRIKEKKNIYRNLLTRQSDTELQEMFAERLKKRVYAIFSKQTKDPNTLEILSILLSNGISATILWWIKDDFKLDTEELAHIHFKTLSTVYIPN